MNGSKQGVQTLRKMRRTLLAGLLGLGLVALWAGAVFAATSQIGPHAFVDSATDDGGGRIRVSWSLEAQPPEGYFFAYSRPEKVCVTWFVVENGVRVSNMMATCFTSKISSQSDLVVDTGIGGDGPATVFSVFLTPFYGGSPFRPFGNDGVLRRTEVTLNASS